MKRNKLLTDATNLKKNKMNLKKKNLLEVRIVATSVGCGINRKGELPKVIEVFCILI